MSRYITAKLAAQHLGKSARHVRRLLAKGDLDGRRTPDGWLVSRSSLDALTGRDSLAEETLAALTPREIDALRSRAFTDPMSGNFDDVSFPGSPEDLRTRVDALEEEVRELRCQMSVRTSDRRAG